MSVITLLLLIPIIAIGQALGQKLIVFQLQHTRCKCSECGKRVKTPNIMIAGPPCPDCLQKLRQREEANGAIGISMGAAGSGLNLTEDMIKMYNDPRLQKALRQAFRPRTEKENWEDEENED